MFVENVASAASTPPVFLPVFPRNAPRIIRVEWSARRIPIVRGGNIRGFHPNRLGGKHPLEFESLLECSVISTLLDRPELKGLTTQPLTIYFSVAGRQHRYTPDLLLEFHEVPEDLAALGFERVSLIECKPAAMLEEQRVVLGRAFAALRELTSTPLLIITSHTLDTVSWEGLDNAA